MKWKQTPNSDVLLEVTPAELKELKSKGGLMLSVETKSGTVSFFWRVQGCWIVLVVKEDERIRGSQPARAK